ncbi:group 1 truncated hemoglobin [Pontibacterium granulatum]|uniref:group I truncated hemoglobin n=1 Tax=Pontibacterium granulatum TaxID=2036029 RepID=UPI00249CB061|nr:group 1 truncated hemoglobin [Pontibacterium granulatum]MDI3325997.1 group 1 truncated hemoglobin [Pontibacterium granulatum]
MHNYHTKTTSLMLALALMLWTPASQADSHSQPSLYERLGGSYAIAMVVDDFIERLLVNDELNANPAVKASRERVPKAGLKFMVTLMVSEVTGGPERYTGRSMKDAHAHLNISDAEWDVMVAEFKKSLAKFNVPQKEQDELLNIVSTTKADIVVARQ